MSSSSSPKLPPDAVAVLSSWFESHLDRPYLTEDEKIALIARTGLRKKQIESWFEKARKKRGLTAIKRFPDEAKRTLERWLERRTSDPYPTEEEKRELVRRTGLEKKQVEGWFEKARAKRGMTRKRRRTGAAGGGAEAEAGVGAAEGGAYGAEGGSPRKKGKSTKASSPGKSPRGAKATSRRTAEAAERGPGGYEEAEGSRCAMDPAAAVRRDVPTDLPSDRRRRPSESYYSYPPPSPPPPPDPPLGEGEGSEGGGEVVGV